MDEKTQTAETTDERPDSEPASGSSDGSIAPTVPKIPGEAVEFAKAVAVLVEKYGISQVTMDMRVDTGYGTKYYDPEFRGNIVEKMKVGVSTRDGRGRPRTQIYVQADMHVSEKVVWEPDSSN